MFHEMVSFFCQRVGKTLRILAVACNVLLFQNFCSKNKKNKKSESSKTKRNMKRVWDMGFVFHQMVPQLMISHDKLGTINYYNLSKIMISYGRFERVFQNRIFFNFVNFFF